MRQTFLDEGLPVTYGVISATNALLVGPTGTCAQALMACGVYSIHAFPRKPGASFPWTQGCVQVSSCRGDPWPDGQEHCIESLLYLLQRVLLRFPYQMVDERLDGLDNPISHVVC